ncbi:MAG: hypothetical protein IH804_01720 [Planctomycetes bacterium]|nr:hypothetical protein [Planctomycetota bacterium]
MIKKLTLLSLALGLPGAGLTAAPPTIERLAPTNSVFIAGINSTKQSIDRLKRTPLWSLWESDEFKALRTRCLEQVNGDLDEFFAKNGIKPQGAPRARRRKLDRWNGFHNLGAGDDNRARVG